jgi:hypothetical protein
MSAAKVKTVAGAVTDELTQLGVVDSADAQIAIAWPSAGTAGLEKPAPLHLFLCGLPALTERPPRLRVSSHAGSVGVSFLHLRPVAHLPESRIVSSRDVLVEIIQVPPEQSRHKVGR